MRLTEICQPLFTYICRLNRAARLGTPAFEPSQVRGDIESILRQIAEEADAAGLTEQFTKIRPPLVYFSDFMVASSGFPWARDYPRIANDEEEFAGDERFFHPLLDEALADTGPGAAERLEVFFECLGLGFTGIYTGDAPEKADQVRQYLNRTAARIREQMDADETTKICPEAYRFTDRTTLYEPVRDKLGAISIVAVGALVVVFVVSGVVYRAQTGQVDKFVKGVVDWAQKH